MACPGERSILAQALVPDSLDSWRLDRCAQELFTELPSKKSAYKAAKAERLLLDGKTAPPNARVHTGQALALMSADTPPPVYHMTLHVVFEDDWLAVIEKPPGIPVSGNYVRTVERALPANLAATCCPDPLPFPRPVHRLDSPTGGLLICAKSHTAMIHLSRQFENRQIQKTYRAIVLGKLLGTAVVERPLDGRPAVTRYESVLHTPSVTSGWVTTVDLHPETGRTHQLRRHMADLGHPVLGDAQYTDGPVLRSKGLFLWAVRIEFSHPQTGRHIVCSVAEPAKFASFRAREERRVKNLPDRGAETGQSHHTSNANPERDRTE